jgi:phage tail-like protein
MSTAARSRPLVGKYAFWVTDLELGELTARFQKASGAGLTLNIGEYHEGGAMVPMKEITTGTYSNITLEHGVGDNNTHFIDWIQDCMNMLRASPFGTGLPSPYQLRNFTIDQLQRDRAVLRTLHCYNCQPAGFKPGEFDNSSTEVQIEELELAIEYFDLVTP